LPSISPLPFPHHLSLISTFPARFTYSLICLSLRFRGLILN
jgi:hypothetical protein